MSDEVRDELINSKCQMQGFLNFELSHIGSQWFTNIGQGSKLLNLTNPNSISPF